MDILTNIKKLSSDFLKSHEIAVDFGTTNTRIGIGEKGIVLREPSFIGVNTRSREYIFFGEEAKNIYGKAPNFINVIKPVHHSIISDFDSTVLLIKHFLEKSVYPYFRAGRILKHQMKAVTSVPTTSTEVEQKAFQEALLKTGLQSVRLIEKPLASAMGAKLPIFSNNPAFIVDMGAGLIEMAVIISGGIVNHKAIKIAGDHMDKLIYNYLHLKYGIICGERTCESLKINLFSLSDEGKTMTIRGKSLEDGLPKSARVKSGDIREALVGNLNQIIDSIKDLLESVPPEIIDGIVKNGITLAGGLAQIGGIERYMTTELKVPVEVSTSPEDANISGLLALLSQKERLERISIM